MRSRAYSQFISGGASSAPVGPFIFGGSATLDSRTGDELHLPEFQATPARGGAFFAQPRIEVPLDFWLQVSGPPSSLSVLYVDSRHLDNRALPSSSAFGTIVAGVLDVTVRVGAYEVRVVGTVVGPTLTGTITLNVRGVREVHSFSVGAGSAPVWPAGNYYSQFGDDLNDGLSLAAPKQTLPAPADNAVIYVELGSTYKGPGIHLADETKTFSVVGVGAGHWVLGDQCEQITTWAAAGAAWTASLPGQVVGIDATTGVSQALEDGFPLLQVSTLLACQGTPGSYFTPTTIGVAPTTIVMYIHPTDGSDPNTNGHIYEIVARETFLAGRGSCHFDGVFGRGSTCPTGSIIVRAKASDGSDDPVVTNYAAFHGTNHNMYVCGGHISNGGTMFVQPQGGASSHMVFHRSLVGEVPTNLHASNLFAISSPVTSVSTNETAWDWHADSTLGTITLDRYYAEFIAGFVFFPSGVAGLVTLTDTLLERLRSSCPQILFSSGYNIQRMRHYQIGAAYWPGPKLMGTDAFDIDWNDALVVTGHGNSVGGNTFDGYVTPDGGPDPATSTVHCTNFTLVNVNNVDSRLVAFYVGPRQAGNTKLAFQIDHGLFHGFNKDVVFGDFTLGTPTRLPGDFSTYSQPLHDWWFNNTIDMGFAQYQAGWFGTLAATDASSSVAASTFSNISGRYPLYTQTSANPGGYTSAFVDPQNYLGVLTTQAFEAAGRLPAAP